MDYHDVLAAFGAGSAHPGGFRDTLFWLDRLQLSPTMRVLEVGCGTGRTACTIQEKFGVQVVGVDIRPLMIEKAKKRAMALSLDTEFVLSEDPNGLPFSDQSFDLIVAESVTIFNKIEDLIKEYFRVLRTSGVVIDTEMAAANTLTPKLLKEVFELYGATRVPTLKEWKQLYLAAGFQTVQTILSGAVHELSMENEVHDGMGIVSPEAFSPQASAIIDRNFKLMQENNKWFAYGVFRAVKE